MDLCDRDLNGFCQQVLLLVFPASKDGGRGGDENADAFLPSFALIVIELQLHESRPNAEAYGFSNLPYISYVYR